MDAAGNVEEWNPAAEQLFGRNREEAIGREVAELVIPGALREAHRNGLRRYLETGESSILDRRVDLLALAADGSEFPIELAVTRLFESDPPVFVAFIRDLRERSRVVRENVRIDQRMAFLAQAGLALDSSLEFSETLHRLVELVVPELAQIAAVDVLEPGGEIRTVVAAAEDPEMARALETMRRDQPLSLSSPHPVAEVLRTGRALLQARIDAEFRRAIAQTEEEYELIRRLGYHSAILVPLLGRERALGTLALIRTEGSEPYEEDDVLLAAELARRAALAIDNARMFEATRDLARTLQESLLPHELPPIPGVRITGRYRAAAQGQEVGGDLYDVFTIEPGRWGITIGDVCGKGPDAAALTAFVRYTIRALAAADPAAVLRQLNDRALRQPPLAPEQLVTVLFAVARLEDEELVVDVASAGHPPSLVRRASGGVEPVPSSGPLIGLLEQPEFECAPARLRPGDALLLYTDGLTDARAPEVILSERELAELVARAPRGDGAQLAEFLEAAVTQGEDPRDDIALLVIERLG